MLIQRHINVDATSWRCIDVNATFYKRHALAGYTLLFDNILNIQYSMTTSVDSDGRAQTDPTIAVRTSVLSLRDGGIR